MRLPRDRFRPVLVTGAGEETTSHGRRLGSAGIEIIPVEQLQVGHPILRWAWAWVRVCRFRSQIKAGRGLMHGSMSELAFLAPICRGIEIHAWPRDAT